VTEAPRVFRRSLAARVTSLVALLLFGAALALRVAAGEYGSAFVVVTALALAAAAGSISAWGDRFVFDDDAVTWENAVLLACAGGRGGWGRRRLAWRDVARVQAHGALRPAGATSDMAGGDPRALFLVPHHGRRMALDALEDFAEVRRRVDRGLASTGVSTPPGDRPR
jgi:hypothetical protein